MQELLVTAMLVVIKKKQFQQPCIYISLFEGERPDTSVYNVDIKSGLGSRMFCEITIRTDWPKADDIEKLIIKKQAKKYPNETAVVIFCDGPASDKVEFSKLHALVQEYSSPYDIFLLYGTTRKDVESMDAREMNLDLSEYTLGEPLILCLQVNKIQRSGAGYLRLPVEIHPCSIRENEFRYNPPYIPVDGGLIGIPNDGA